MTEIVTLLSVSFLGQGQSSEEVRINAEQEINSRKSRLEEGGFEVECLVNGGFVEEDGKFKYDLKSWNKIIRFELLETLRLNGLLERDESLTSYKIVVDQDNLKEMVAKNRPAFSQDFNFCFPDGENSYNATEEVKFYHDGLSQRMTDVLTIIQNPQRKILFNMGGGSVNEEYVPQKLDEMIKSQSGFNPTPTTIFGFSTETTLPFYFSDKYEGKITLVQASNLFDIEYLQGKRKVEINLKPVAEAKLPPQNLSGDALAISVHTAYNQMFENCCVGQNAFDDKVVMIESAYDPKMVLKIEEMISAGVFDKSKAVILGEFSQAFHGDEQKQQAFFATVFDKLNERKIEIPILQSAESQSVFGHGCRRSEYIASTRCTVDTDGKYSAENAISVANETSPNSFEKTEATNKKSWAERVRESQASKDNGLFGRVG